MAKGASQLDSFFIDEGFGTLDEECLEQVIDILFDLSLRGKQVGIISHVAKLTHAIPSKIQIEKREDGSVNIQSLSS